MDGQSRYHVGYANLPQHWWRPFVQNELTNWPFLPYPGCVTPPKPPYQCYSSLSCVSTARITGPSFQQLWKQAPPEVQRYLDTDANKSNGNHVSVEQELSSVLLKLHCNTCEKTFQNNDSLNSHLRSHTKCLFPNCTFVASRQTLKLHEIQCHREGKLKIVLDTPEQIAKWRAERKRNYPTLSNVKKKEEEEKRKSESGQTINQKEFRYNKRQGWKYRAERDCSRRGKRTNHQSYSKCRQSKQNNSYATAQNERDESVSLLKENIQDDDNRNDTGPFEKDSQESVLNGGALGAIAAVYAATSSDDDEEHGHDNEKQSQRENEETFMASQPATVQEPKKMRLAQSDVNNNKKLVKTKKTLKRFKKSHKQDNIQKHQRPSLLEMLLAPDIRHERNVLMQCIRHIVKKDFFGIGCHDSVNISE